MRTLSLTLLILTLGGCAGYTPAPKPLPFKDQIVFSDHREICSATDNAKVLVWSCK
jgi:hypothetical protein